MSKLIYISIYKKAKFLFLVQIFHENYSNLITFKNVYANKLLWKRYEASLQQESPSVLRIQHFLAINVSQKHGNL